MAKADHKEWVRAYVLGDTAAAEEINQRMPEDERVEFHLYVMAFCILMLDQRFQVKPTREDIHTFVEELKYDYRNAPNPIKPLMVEGTIRSLYDEEDLMDELPMDEVVRAQYLTIAKIAVQTPDVTQNIDKYLVAAEKIAAEMS